MTVIIDNTGLELLLSQIRADGFALIGPTVDSGAIVYDEINGLKDLPKGLTSEQEAGRYRLKKRDDDALFGYTVGPTPWKKFLHPPKNLLFETDVASMTFRAPAEPPRYAFLGVRSCDLAAMKIYDRVMLGGEHVNDRYAARREGVLIVAVQCGLSAPTCFCVSANTGPRAQSGFDIALTELSGGRFLVEVGSDAGKSLMDAIPTTAATPADTEESLALTEDAARQQTRTLPSNAAQILKQKLDDPHWEDVAKRCLTCANCTMSCPTCFCTDTQDTVTLDGATAQRWESWASCFSIDYAYMHGGSVRNSAKSRYRQWLTHKLSTWHDQFGSSGCVGCGRCIVWCPVGIDLTAEVASLSGSQS